MYMIMKIHEVDFAVCTFDLPMPCPLSSTPQVQIFCGEERYFPPRSEDGSGGERYREAWEGDWPGGIRLITGIAELN